MTLQWEQINTPKEYTIGSSGTLFRAKVPGGWMLSTSGGIVFYPNDDFSWADYPSIEWEELKSSENFLKAKLFDLLGINVSISRRLFRTKVPGGWLIVSVGHVTFYPDPEHTWDGSSIP